jgi:hypothetical protein
MNSDLLRGQFLFRCATTISGDAWLEESINVSGKGCFTPMQLMTMVQREEANNRSTADRRLTRLITKILVEMHRRDLLSHHT